MNEAAESKLRRWEWAVSRGEDPEVTRLRQQGGLEREVRAIHVERFAKAPVQAPQPVQEEEGEEMEEDTEESESSVGGGTRSAPIEVHEEVVVPQELSKPVEENQKPRAEEATTGAFPKNGIDATAAAMGQWAGGPPKDRRRVVVEEGPVEARRKARPEMETIIPVTRSTDVGME